MTRSNGAKSDWTPEMKAVVHQWWGDKTAREIGELIGGKTKSAVLGMAHRLGLSGEPNISGKALRKRQKELRRMLWNGNSATKCQYPSGEPRERNFCGKPVARGSYCAAHYKACHVPSGQNAA